MSTELFPGADALTPDDREHTLQRIAKLGRNPLPPVTCWPFCTYGDGHPGSFHHEDQACYSKDRRTTATLYPPQEYFSATGTRWEPEFLAVYAMGTHDGTPNRVVVRVGDADGIDMTAAEARMIASFLFAAIDEISKVRPA